MIVIYHVEENDVLLCLGCSGVTGTAYEKGVSAVSRLEIDDLFDSQADHNCDFCGAII